MHALQWIGYGVAVAFAFVSAATAAYGAWEADGSAPTIERSAVIEECGHRDANDGCELDFMRRRLCEGGYQLEWLRADYGARDSEVSTCLFREQ